MLKKIIFAILISSFLFSCTKKTNQDGKSSLNIQLEYGVKTASLIFDSLMYVNAANNQYSVTNLEYIISNIQLTNNHNEIIKYNNIVYVDARKAMYNSFVLNDVPYGSYKSISFNIGLNQELNISNSLPSTTEFINMAWPDMMGGGYHFLKLEGNVLDSLSQSGYAMHLGTDAGLVTCVIDSEYLISTPNSNFKLHMDVNEWFENPQNYDLIVDGNYTMGNMMLMSRIAKNGYNVFNLIQ